MRPQIPVPTRGMPLRASWGVQVSDRLNELCAMSPAGVLHREGFGGTGDQALPKNMRGRLAAPRPFELAFAPDVGESGSWIIYLPGSDLLVVDGQSVEIAPASAAVGNPYPAGWYKLDCIESTPATLYLNLHVDDDTGAVEASFDTSVDTAEEGESVWPVVVADITSSQVVQLVSSALFLRINVYYV